MWKEQLPQFVAAGVATLGAFGLGTVAGWTSPSFPSLKQSPTFANLSEEAYSWIGSIAPIGACCSGPIAGFLVDKVGRKKCMLLLSPIFIVGWLLIYFSQCAEMLFAGRFLTGFSGGGFSLAAPVYISETAQDSIRGTLGSSLQLMINCGVLFTYVLGYFLPWDFLALICSFIPAIFIICMLFMPESPRYLLSKHDKDGALKALQWLRNQNDPNRLFMEIETTQRSLDEQKPAQCKSMIQPAVLKPLSISMALMMFQQWNGNNAIVFYTVDIFNSAGSALDSNMATIIVGAVQVLASIVSAILMDRAGRRILLIISGALMTFGLTVLGVFFYLKKVDPVTATAIGWLPLLCLITFIVAFSIGFGPIAWLMVGEILPLNVKGTASAMATSFNWLNTFLVTKAFNNIESSIGMEWCFWVFGIATILGTIFVIMFVPETKGKSLDEIQLFFDTDSPKESQNSLA